MTNEKLKDAAVAISKFISSKYRGKHSRVFFPARYPDDQRPTTINVFFRHLLYLSEQVPKLIDAGARDKAILWIGFAQGTLWTLSQHTLGELNRMNHPGETY